MTDNYRRDWYNKEGYYYKPPFRETQFSRSPNSSVETINHFSKPRILRQYKNPQGYYNDGFSKTGEYTSLTFWCFIRGIWADKKDGVIDNYTDNGVITEGRLAVYYNPYHINHPPEGIHLHLTNPRSELTMDYYGFADIIEYDGFLWKVIKHNLFDVAYDNNPEYIGKATIALYNESIVNESNLELDNSPIYKVK